MNGPSSHLRTSPRPSLITLALSATLVALAACKSDETVVQYKPFFSGLSGAQFNTEPVNTAPGYTDPTVTPDGQSVITKPDGSRILICKSVRSLMTHLERELDDGNTDIILQQLISQRTLDEYEGRGETPKAIVDHLQKYRRDIAMLFARMPMAERSPTVILKQPGDGVWILRVTGAAADDLRFTKLWVVMEHGNWKFYWMT